MARISRAGYKYELTRTKPGHGLRFRDIGNGEIRLTITNGAEEPIFRKEMSVILTEEDVQEFESALLEWREQAR